MYCPCHSGQRFDQCCDRFISHREQPENAHQLMRSRYCAYSLADREYILETWHADFRPRQFSIDRRICWIGLDIIARDEQGTRAMVEFEARLMLENIVEALHERSAFVRTDGQWLYTTGDIMTPSFAPWKPGRNESCPCGSGLKFKRCCARR